MVFSLVVVFYLDEISQICGEAALQKTTLRGLGLTSGRAVLRYVH